MDAGLDAPGGVLCAVCSSAAAVLHCVPDQASLCLACDQQIHGRNALAARHLRVQLCELCERVPAAVYCQQVCPLLACSTSALTLARHRPGRRFALQRVQ